MDKLGKIIKELTRLSEAGYVLAQNEKHLLVELAREFDSPYKEILLSNLVDLGLMNTGEINSLMRTRRDSAGPTISVLRPMEEWISWAERSLESPPSVGTIDFLRDFYDIEDIINNYPLSLRDDDTIAGLIYKGNDRYDYLLRFLIPETIANIYLSHYKHKNESIRAFYHIFTSEHGHSIMPVLDYIFTHMSPQRRSGFVMRIKANAKNVLGEEKCKELGSRLLIELLKNYADKDSTNTILHTIYFLGIDSVVVDRAQISLTNVDNFLKLFEIFKVIYMKYRDTGVFPLSDQCVARQDYQDVYALMYMGIVDDEGRMLLADFFRLRRELRNR